VATDESTPPEPEPRTACHWTWCSPPWSGSSCGSEACERRGAAGRAATRRSVNPRPPQPSQPTTAAAPRDARRGPPRSRPPPPSPPTLRGERRTAARPGSLPVMPAVGFATTLSDPAANGTRTGAGRFSGGGEAVTGSARRTAICPSRRWAHSARAPAPPPPPPAHRRRGAAVLRAVSGCGSNRCRASPRFWRSLSTVGAATAPISYSGTLIVVSSTMRAVRVSSLLIARRSGPTGSPTCGHGSRSDRVRSCLVVFRGGARAADARFGCGER
jgi:hypothetical protein